MKRIYKISFIVFSLIAIILAFIQNISEYCLSFQCNEYPLIYKLINVYPQIQIKGLGRFLTYIILVIILELILIFLRFIVIALIKSPRRKYILLGLIIILFIFSAFIFHKKIPFLATYIYKDTPWKLYEGSACNFTYCFTSEINQKYNYWLDQAVIKRNPNLCNNVEGRDNGDYMDPKEMAVYFCKATYGGRVGDINYCLSLDTGHFPGTASQQYVCFAELLKNVSNIDTCNKFPTNTYPVNSKYECYSTVAKKNKDVNICKEIPEEGYGSHARGSRRNCLIDVGKVLKNTQVCNYLADNLAAKECVDEIKNR